MSSATFHARQEEKSVEMVFKLQNVKEQQDLRGFKSRLRTESKPVNARMLCIHTECKKCAEKDKRLLAPHPLTRERGTSLHECLDLVLKKLAGVDFCRCCCCWFLSLAHDTLYSAGGSSP